MPGRRKYTRGTTLKAVEKAIASIKREDRRRARIVKREYQKRISEIREKKGKAANVLQRIKTFLWFILQNRRDIRKMQKKIEDAPRRVIAARAIEGIENKEARREIFEFLEERVAYLQRRIKEYRKRSRVMANWPSFFREDEERLLATLPRQLSRRFSKKYGLSEDTLNRVAEEFGRALREYYFPYNGKTQRS
ncbi:MAG: hypothetical protein J7L14_03290 [Candidatus Diapherotrites archaeon]|nr:hypothetical protein [Candidatus Diapherotrites archaeon]